MFSVSKDHSENKNIYTNFLLLTKMWFGRKKPETFGLLKQPKEVKESAPLSAIKARTQKSPHSGAL